MAENENHDEQRTLTIARERSLIEKYVSQWEIERYNADNNVNLFLET